MIDVKTELEHKIQNFIWRDNGCTVHFKYSEEGIGVGALQVVEVFTVNPKNQEKFLLVKKMGSTIEIALGFVFEYVEAQKGLGSFTIQWSKIGDKDIPVTKINSYFYCHDIQEAINKFFVGKDVKDYIIYEAKLNPIS